MKSLADAVKSNKIQEVKSYLKNASDLNITEDDLIAAIKTKNQDILKEICTAWTKQSNKALFSEEPLLTAIQDGFSWHDIKPIIQAYIGTGSAVSGDSLVAASKHKDESFLKREIKNAIEKTNGVITADHLQQLIIMGKPNGEYIKIACELISQRKVQLKEELLLTAIENGFSWHDIKPIIQAYIDTGSAVSGDSLVAASKHKDESFLKREIKNAIEKTNGVITADHLQQLIITEKPNGEYIKIACELISQRKVQLKEELLLIAIENGFSWHNIKPIIKAYIDTGSAISGDSLVAASKHKDEFFLKREIKDAIEATNGVVTGGHIEQLATNKEYVKIAKDCRIRCEIIQLITAENNYDNSGNLVVEQKLKNIINNVGEEFAEKALTIYCAYNNSVELKEIKNLAKDYKIDLEKLYPDIKLLIADRRKKISKEMLCSKYMRDEKGENIVNSASFFQTPDIDKLILDYVANTPAQLKNTRN